MIFNDKTTITVSNPSCEAFTGSIFSTEAMEFLERAYLCTAVERRLMYEPSWLGMRIIQLPNDIIAMQEAIYRVKPDLIIETGVAHGGSLIYYSSLLECINPKGKIIGIDVDIRSENRELIERHPLAHRITLIEASSTSATVVEKINTFIGNGEYQKCLVSLDSDHSYEHVRNEIEIYKNFVSADSYLIVQDSAMDLIKDIPSSKANWRVEGPSRAISEFTKENSNFVVDARLQRFGISSSPGGFLLRTS